MKAAGLDYRSKSAEIRDLPPPPAAGPGQVRFRVREVGVCGTDRELALFHFGLPPEGETFLVLGHEAAGEVDSVGEGVAGFKKGDWVAPMVRRSCQPPCDMCSRRRRDLCVTGGYTDRGVLGAHGYLTEWAVDSADDLVRIPVEAASFGVLVEPLSVVEKAITTLLRIHPGGPKSALVIGAGPIGLLSAMALLARGFSVTLHSKEPPDDPRAALAAKAGARYVSDASRVDRADIAIEAAGVPAAGFLAMDRLAANGVCALIGARPGSGEMPFRRMILENQSVFGTVSASPDAFRDAADDLRRFDRRLLDAMLHRVRLDAFPGTVGNSLEGAVKVVHVID